MVGNSTGYYSQPRYVILGDINNDTWLDIVVANYGTDNVGIFLAMGNGSFISQKTYSTGTDSGPYAVAVGDFNNDYRLDVAVANYDTNNVGILFGYGDGTFDNQKEIFLGASRPIHIATGDLNNDGRLDIVVAAPSTSSIEILFGHIDGLFETHVRYFTGYDSHPHSVVVADFNNDHLLDIAVANKGTHNIGVFLGLGNKRFSEQRTFTTGLGSDPCSIAAADVDGNHQIDLVVANAGTGSIGILIGFGNGTFMAQMKYFISADSKPNFISLGDFNKDRQLDIAVADIGTYDLTVLIGYSNGMFASPTIHSSNLECKPFLIAAGDLNNDNQSDIAIASLETNNMHVMINYAQQPSENPPTYSTGQGSTPYQVLLRDFNNDTWLDIAVINKGTKNIGIFLGYGNGSFAEELTYSTGNPSGPTAFAISDFNNDNVLDIVVCNVYTNNIGLLLGYGNGSFANVTMYNFGQYFSPKSVAVADFNNDGQQDLAICSYGPNTISIIFGKGNGDFELRVKYSTGEGSRPYWVAVEDFNNDHIPDIAVANSGTNSIGIYLGYGNGHFGPLKTYSSGYASTPVFIEFGDFNNDSKLDIVVINSNTKNLVTLIGDGSGAFATSLTLSSNLKLNSYGLDVGDFNADGCQDIAIANSYMSSIDVVLGYCNGNFTSRTSFPTGYNSHPMSVVVGDVNNDNRLDIITGNTGTNSVTIFLGRHDNPDSTYPGSILNASNMNTWTNETQGSSGEIYQSPIRTPFVLFGNYYSDFKNTASYATGSGSHPYSVATGDFNNDKLIDIAIANSGNENIDILLGYGNGYFASKSSFSTGSGSTPQNLLVVDISHDNKLYIILTNPRQDNLVVLTGHGDGNFSVEKTIPTGVGSNPNGLTSGDLNNDDYLDVVIANPGTDSIGIVLGYRYATFQSAVKYPNVDLSGALSIRISDLNNDGVLDIVVANFLTDNVGIFLGHADGTFMTQKVYQLMIGSHPRVITLGDFNNDTYLDIATCNWASNSITTLLGHGNGTFNTIAYYSTGISTRPSGINVGDFNNDDCLDIVVCNYGSDALSLFFGYGNGSFRNYTTVSTGYSSAPNAADVVDLNNDNHIDMIVVNEGTDNIGILYGYGDGTFANIITYSTGYGSAPRHASTADLNKDNRLDIVVACRGTGKIVVFFSDEKFSFASGIKYSSGLSTGSEYATSADFNNDNNLDIIIANTYYGYFSVLFGYGNGKFTSAVLYPTDSGTILNSIGVGDFNHDSRLDVAYVDAINNNVEVRFSSDINYIGSQNEIFIGEGSMPSSVATAHFNTDEWLDIVVVNYGTDSIGILLGIGDANFKNMTTYSTGNYTKPISVAVNDINNDNLTDIIVATSGTGHFVVFLGYSNGIFIMSSVYSTDIASGPASVLIGYINDDQWLDVAVVNSISNNIVMFKGFGDGTFIERAVYSVGYGGHPKSIAFGNFQSANHTNIVVANYDTDTVLLLVAKC